MLDSDVCVEIIRGRGGPLHAYGDARLVISAVTRYELRVGAAKSRSRKGRQRTGSFLEHTETLEFGVTEADRAGTLRAELERTGRGIGPYDYLIAGHALSAGCALLTGNVEEFARVPGLEVLRWTHASR
jgi:tRNA(fMet)-specific endonuclease VapC